MTDLWLLAGLVVAGAAGPVWFLLQGPPFVPTNDFDAEQMVRAVEALNPRRIIDLGAGDGKLVMTFAEHGYDVDGVEINPRLVRRGQKRLAKRRLSGKASLKRGNLWKTDVSGYDVVLLYAVTTVMSRLERKLCVELRPGSYVVSNYFAFPNLRPVRTYGRIKVYEIT